MGLTVTLTLSITLTLTLILTLTHPAPYLQDGSKYNCAYYAQDDKCAKYGSSYANEGVPANVACCDCGGGVKSIQARRELKFDYIVRKPIPIHGPESIWCVLVYIASESPYLFMGLCLSGVH